MKDVNLKIKIKEVKEEIRELTIEERCLNLVTVALVPGCSKECRAEASAKLDSIGFVSYQGTLGKFRTVTIRDATPKEIIAWHTLQSLYVCSHNMPIQLCSQCANNLGPIGCNIGRARERAEGILKDKEVILSLTEE